MSSHDDSKEPILKFVDPNSPLERSLLSARPRPAPTQPYKATMYLERETARRLKIVGARLDRTLQDLLTEAAESVLERYEV